MLLGCLAPTGRGVPRQHCGEIASIDVIVVIVVIVVIAVIDVKQAGTPAHPDSIFLGGGGNLKNSTLGMVGRW